VSPNSKTIANGPGSPLTVDQVHDLAAAMPAARLPEPFTGSLSWRLVYVLLAAGRDVQAMLEALKEGPLNEQPSHPFDRR
jgi:hypothetical protein